MAAIGISGTRGLIGSALAADLQGRGHAVRRLGRGPYTPQDVAGLDAVVHLGGAGLADRRWSADRKREVVASRVESTTSLAIALAAADPRPRAFLCASAVGYYGPRGEEPADESAPAGTGFLAEVCRAWEEATGPAAAAGIRTVRMRFGVVLSPRGGALKRMILPFRLGLGGPIGTGRQGFSWIALEDVLAAVSFLLEREDASGPVNVTAPEPISQRTFARALGRALRRPAVAPLPAPLVRLLFGEMGEEALLAGQYVVPAKLEGMGFRFSRGRLADALAVV